MNNDLLARLIAANPYNSTNLKMFEQGLATDANQPMQPTINFVTHDDLNNRILAQQQAEQQAKQQALQDEINQKGLFKGQIDNRNDLEKNIGGILGIGGLLGTIGDAGRAGGAALGGIGGDLATLGSAALGGQIADATDTIGSLFGQRYAGGSIPRAFQGLNLKSPGDIFNNVMKAAQSPQGAEGTGLGSVLAQNTGVNDGLMKTVGDFGSSVLGDPTTYLGGVGLKGIKGGLVNGAESLASGIGSKAGDIASKIPGASPFVKGLQGADNVANATENVSKVVPTMDQIAKDVTKQSQYSAIQRALGATGGNIPGFEGQDTIEQVLHLNGMGFKPSLNDWAQLQDTFPSKAGNVYQAALQKAIEDGTSFNTQDLLNTLETGVNGSRYPKEIADQLKNDVIRKIVGETPPLYTTPNGAEAERMLLGSYNPMQAENLKKALQGHLLNDTTKAQDQGLLRNAVGDLYDHIQNQLGTVKADIKPEDILTGTPFEGSQQALNYIAPNTTSLGGLSKINQLGAFVNAAKDKAFIDALNGVSNASDGGLYGNLFNRFKSFLIGSPYVKNPHTMIADMASGVQAPTGAGFRYAAGNAIGRPIEGALNLADKGLNSRYSNLAQSIPANIYGMFAQGQGDNQGDMMSNPSRYLTSQDMQNSQDNQSQRYGGNSGSGNGISDIINQRINDRSNMFGQLQGMMNPSTGKFYTPAEAKTIVDMKAPLIRMNTQDLKTLQGAYNAINTLDQLQGVFDKSGGGQGALGALTDLSGSALGGVFNQNAKLYQNLKEGLIGRLKSIAGENGVLSDYDSKRLLNLLPSHTDSPETAKQKIAEMKSMLASSIQNAQNTYATQAFGSGAQ